MSLNWLDWLNEFFIFGALVGHISARQMALQSVTRCRTTSAGSARDNLLFFGRIFKMLSIYDFSFCPDGFGEIKFAAAIKWRSTVYRFFFLAGFIREIFRIIQLLKIHQNISAVLFFMLSKLMFRIFDHAIFFRTYSKLHSWTLLYCKLAMRHSFTHWFFVHYYIATHAI